MHNEITSLINPKLESLLQECRKQNKKSVFCFASTKNKSTKNYYFTTLRVSEEAICLCLMIQDLNHLKEMTDIIDGKVDYILYDAEVKFPELKNLPVKLKTFVKKSKIVSFLGNKTTAHAATSFIQHHFRKMGQSSISGDVLIFGAGHLGSLIAQDLVETGCRVTLVRRSLDKAIANAEAINNLKSPFSEGLALAQSQSNLKSDSFDVIIACTNEPGSVGLELVKHTSSNCLFMDVGIGNFSVESLEFISSRQQIVYMANVLNSFNATLSFILKDEVTLSSPDHEKVEGLEIYRSGVIAPKGAVVVDNISNTKAVFGVSTGTGSLFKEDDGEEYKTKIAKAQKLLIKS